MEEEIEDEEENPAKEKIVRAVLLFCALVVAGVAAYTTFMLFSTYELDISLSPPENAAQFSLPEEDNMGTASFDMEQKRTDDAGQEKLFKDEEIRPSPVGGIFTPNPLIITEDLDSGNGRLVFIVIALEIIVIFFIYRKLDKKIGNSNN